MGSRSFGGGGGEKSSQKKRGKEEVTAYSLENVFGLRGLGPADIKTTRLLSVGVGLRTSRQGGRILSFEGMGNAQLLALDRTSMGNKV